MKKNQSSEKQNKQQLKNAVKKRQYIIIITALFAVICLVILGKFTTDRITAAKILKEGIAADKALAVRIFNETGIKIAGTVNGEPFLQEDLNVYMAEHRAAVASHFGRRYNITFMGASFWDTEYDGTTPREFLTSIARQELVKNMVLIQQARIRGIDTPDTYSDLEKEREVWNTPTDEIVYGPRTLGPAEYKSYRITGISNALKTNLLRNELSPTIAQLRASFDSLPDINKIADVFSGGIRFTWNAGPFSNEEVFASIENLLRQGLPPEEVVRNLSMYPGLTQEEFESDSRYVSREDPYEIELSNILREAPIGALVRGPEGWPSFYHVTHREGGGYYTFEEAPGLGRNKWINDQFEIFLEEKIKVSRITLFTDADFL